MSLEKFTSVFEEAVEDIESGSLTADTNYQALKAWDSLAILTVTDAIEMEYGVLLNKKHFEGAATIRELHAIVLSKGLGTDK